VLWLGGWQWGTSLEASAPLYQQATTACLCGIIAMQMVAVFNCRHESRSLFRHNPLSNRMLLVGVGLEALILVALNTLPPVRAAMGTAALPLQAWLALPPFMLLMVLLEEFRKALQRRSEAAWMLGK
jgi:magnesium-transporting ATPase (P-type)